ncbi:MAG: ABC transporter permease [Bacteroidales bacterium]|nr:ABC transporter permease [Bacteroidales bacterium]
MRFWGVVIKSFKEQKRSFWLLFLTIITAPFFVVVYKLITESYQPSYDILMYNADKGFTSAAGVHINYGDSLKQRFLLEHDQAWNIRISYDTADALQQIRNNRADLLMIIPGNFTGSLKTSEYGRIQKSFSLEFAGNTSDYNYMISAILAYELVSQFVTETSGSKPQFDFTETSIGASGSKTDFELAVPGLMIFAIIMLMLTASVAMVNEVENKTIYRLRLSKVTTFELMGGISVVQILVGFLSVLLTIAVAAMLGYRFEGSVFPVLVIVLLTTISIIIFSLFIAAFSKTATQVLIIGNFPLFIFMFFTGAMFPVNLKPWFSVQGYEISAISLLSPTHAVSALNKIMIMQLNLKDVLQEIICLCLLSMIYLAGGMWVYNRKHMTIESGRS